MFVEKADSHVLQKCRTFIDNNKEAEKDCELSREALHLCSELISSLLASHQEFEDAIRTELERIEQGNEWARTAAIIRFNNLKLSIALDQEAASILNELERIRAKNA